jgi:hypothetical protein
MPRIQRRTRSRQRWTPLVAVLAAFLVILLSLRNLSDLAAESAGSQRNRKFGPGARSDIDPRELKRLEQLLRSRVGDIDVPALARACEIDTDRINLSALNSACARHPVEARVYILGERHSGSNIASALAYSNFDLDLEPVSSVRKTLGPGISVDETVRKEFGMNTHKHNIQADTGSYGGLAILAVRNPYDFVRALHRQCYFCDASNKQADIRDFVNKPWKAGAHIEQPYQDIFDLRKTKICAWIEVAATRSNCLVIARAEELVLPSTQRAFVQKIRKMTGWSLHDEDDDGDGIRTSGSQNVGRGRGERFDAAKYFTENVLFISPDTDSDAKAHRLLIQNVKPRIDPVLERALGYIL